MKKVMKYMFFYIYRQSTNPHRKSRHLLLHLCRPLGRAGTESWFHVHVTHAWNDVTLIFISEIWVQHCNCWDCRGRDGASGRREPSYMRLMGVCRWVAFSIELPQSSENKLLPCINPSQCKKPSVKLSLQIYKPLGGLYLEIALKYKVKQSKNGKFPSFTIRLAQSILKRIISLHR